jgi:RNA polymerase-binding transcription factor DksA
MSSYNQEIDELITKAETDCFKICEVCGKPGELYTRGFWLRTLCEESAQLENKSKEDLPGFIKHSEWIKLVQAKETKET